MVEKAKYIERFKKLYQLKNKKTLTDELAFEYFEKLVCLAGTITSHVPINRLIVQKDERRKNRTTQTVS